MVEVGTGSLDTLRFIRTLHKKMETHAASIMKKERERDGQNFDARKVENVSYFCTSPYKAVLHRVRLRSYPSLSLPVSSLATGCTWQRQWHAAFCS